jgi:hypothetical protein
MRYEKPELILSGPAVALIQGSLDKSKAIASDALHPTELVATSPAYEEE